MQVHQVIVYKYGFPADEISPDISPFVVKLETWLRMSAIPYETRTGAKQNMPKAKLPVAEIDGVVVPDSDFIIEHLQQRDDRALSNQALTPVQQAQAAAVAALVEDRLYFLCLYLRWCVPSNVELYKPLLLDYARRSVPRWQRPLVPLVGPLAIAQARRQLARQAWYQGVARHSYDEVVQLGLKACQALATLLQPGPYLFGTEPCATDATVFGAIHALVRHPFESPVKDFVRGQPHVLAYHDRIWQRYWTPPLMAR